jgi:hypothetical protein
MQPAVEAVAAQRNNNTNASHELAVDRMRARARTDVRIATGRTVGGRTNRRCAVLACADNNNGHEIK